jgi:hypothetical protein
VHREQEHGEQMEKERLITQLEKNLDDDDEEKLFL